MIDVFDLYNQFNAQNNTYQGGLWRPTDFVNTVYDVSLEIWEEWTAQVNKSQEIQDNLAPFLNTVQVVTKKTAGNYVLVNYPKIYGRYSSARVLSHNDECFTDTAVDLYDECGECKVRAAEETEIQKEQRESAYKDGIIEATIIKVEKPRWASVLTHETKKPTLEKPAMTQDAEGFKVAPRQVTTIILDYYVKPQYKKVVYTTAPGNPQTGAGDYLIYDKNQSQPLEWGENMIPEFLDRLKEKYGGYIRSEFLVQTAKKH